MCDTDEQPAPISRRSTPSLCNKCKQAKPITVFRHSAWCRSCFLFAYVGKYIKVMEKVKPRHQQSVADPQTMLIAYSGGASSSSLLQLSYHYLPKADKQFSPYARCKVLHVDESTVLGIPKTTSAARQAVQTAGHEFIPAKLEDLFDGPDPSVQLKDTFDSVSTLTAKEDLLYHLRMRLIIQIAKREGCHHIFFGDTSTRIAIKLISSASKGRGFSIPIEIASETAFFEDVLIVRPLKDALAKEVAIYNRLERIPMLVIPTLTTGMSEKASIERLTEHFIVGLERDFPSTVSTVARTGAKLKVHNDVRNGRTCPICMMPVQENAREWSRQITVSRAPHESSTTESLEALSLEPSLADVLCYSCIVSVKDHKDPLSTRSLPKSIQEDARAIMKDSIKDHLLEGAEEEL